MRNFRILSPTHKLSQTELDLVIRSFADFYNEQTPKHQRIISLDLILDETTDKSLLEKMISYSNASNCINIHTKLSNNERIELYEQASLFFYPYLGKHRKLVPEAYSFGLPVLCLETQETSELVDITCGVKVKFNSIETTTAECSNIIEMLYFDPEVRRILEKGALDKYEEDFSWGQRFNRTSRAFSR